jgi:hypothetical protein
VGVQDFEALKDMLSKFDSVNVIIPDGPGESLLLFLQTCVHSTEASQVAFTDPPSVGGAAKATLQGLRSQAMTMLASVKGAEPLLAMLKAMEKKEEAAPAAPTPAAPVAAAAPVATPAVAVAPPAPAAPVASVAPVAPVTPVASVAPSGPIAPIAVETPATTETA